MSDIVILEALDQSGLKQLWNAVGPQRVREARNVLRRREQKPLRLKHRNRRRLRNRQLSLDGLARRPEILRGPQIVSHFLRRRAATRHLFKPRDDAVEFAGISRQALGENLQICNRVLQWLRIFGQHRIHSPQRIAGSLRHALASPGFGDQCRDLTGIRQ